jgi:hypothetical protein
MQKHRLCLIVGVVRYGNIVASETHALLFERRITQTASAFLDPLPRPLGFLGNIDRNDRKRDRKLRAKPAAKGGVGKLLLSADPMLNVERRELDFLRCGNLGKAIEQKNRIGTARERDEDPYLGRRQKRPERFLHAP